MAQHCEKCNTKLILMSGMVYGNADEEPYEADVIEEAEVSNCEIWINFMYCHNCDSAKEDSFSNS